MASNHPSSIEDLLVRRFFYLPSFEIYGGVSGLYDYGPLGCSLQTNLISWWRQHFIIEENMLECETSIITPHKVLETSGHVARFADYMIKDTSTGEFFRADHILKQGLQKLLDYSPQHPDMERDLARIDSMDKTELESKLKEYNIVSDCGNSSKVMDFNLMFETSIGPTGTMKAYLRPETAQGQFVNFKRLLESNNYKMPFASVQIGKSFRNEISPRSGLLRVREFTMAEIEHYVDPRNKNHFKFHKVSQDSIPLMPRSTQERGSSDISIVKVGDAIEDGLIANQTMGYFLARIYRFLVDIGIRKDKIRFRQHCRNEMAHYASDCWDAEIQTLHGWIECVGCADREAYDLTLHSKATGIDLRVREQLEHPLVVEECKLEANKKDLGIRFKHESKALCAFLEGLDQEELQKVGQCLAEKRMYSATVQGKHYHLGPELIKVTRNAKKLHVHEYIPCVVEPSFGLGRILHALLEHSHWIREEDEHRAVLSLAPQLAPTKVLVSPVMVQKIFKDHVERVGDLVKSMGLACQVDLSSASIGKKYSRGDEIGIPFAITIDHQTLGDNTITIRERDSTTQIRVGIDSLSELLNPLINGQVSWETLASR